MGSEISIVFVFDIQKILKARTLEARCGRTFCSFNEEKLQNRYSCGKAAAMSKIRRQDSEAPGFCGVGFSTIR
jgi:hypothetical protein